MRPAFRGWIARLFLFALVSCRPNADQEIIGVLDQELRSVVRGDAAGFLRAFNSSYRDELYPLAEVKDKITTRLSSPPLLSASALSRKIEREGDRAVVQQEFYLEGVLAGKARRYQEVEHLRLGKIGGQWRILGGSSLFQLLAGRVEEEDRIVRVLAERGNALESGDLERYMAVVSPDYSQQGQGPEAVRRKVAGIFESFQDVHYRVYDRKLRLNGKEAVVLQGFRLEAVPRSAERGSGQGGLLTFEDRERLELLREDGGWKIIRGL